MMNAFSLVTPDTPFRALGNTDRERFRQALSRSASRRKSPVAPEAGAIYDLLAPRGLTRLAAAMAWMERRNDTNDADLVYYGRDLHNLWALKHPNGGWRSYPSYTAAAADWADHILGPTYADLVTLGQFVARYAPWSDGNNPTHYGAKAAREINALPLRKEAMPSPMPEPTPPTPGTRNPTPTIYDLRHDAHAARFGLTPAERDRLLAKKIPGRDGRQPEAIGLHVQWGNTPGSLRHWLGVDASATVMVQRDGSILKVIPETDGPWTQGDVKHPGPRARRLLDRFGPDPNIYSLTIEAEDERTEQINETQARTILWQIRQWQQTWPRLADPERILGHFEINSVDRARCGRYRDAIVRELLAGEPLPAPEPEFPGLPPWLPADALRAAFPLADPQGVATRALIAWIGENERLPWFVEKRDLGAGRNLWRFDCLTLFNDGPRVWMEGEAAS
jgi:hypothetical protein